MKMYGGIFSIQTPGFSAEPALPAFCRLAFDFAGLDENLVAFCRLESFVGFRFCQLEITVLL